jgi:hypothetical protein
MEDGGWKKAEAAAALSIFYLPSSIFFGCDNDHGLHGLHGFKRKKDFVCGSCSRNWRISRFN